MSILQIFIGVVLVAEGLFVWRYGRKQLGMVLAVNAFVNGGAVLLLARSFMAPSMAALGALGANDGLSQMSSMFFWMWVGLIVFCVVIYFTAKGFAVIYLAAIPSILTLALLYSAKVEQSILPGISAGVFVVALILSIYFRKAVYALVAGMQGGHAIFLGLYSLWVALNPEQLLIVDSARMNLLGGLFVAFNVAGIFVERYWTSIRDSVVEGKVPLQFGETGDVRQAHGGSTGMGGIPEGSEDRVILVMVDGIETTIRESEYRLSGSNFSGALYFVEGLDEWVDQIKLNIFLDKKIDPKVAGHFSAATASGAKNLRGISLDKDRKTNADSEVNSANSLTFQELMRSLIWRKETWVLAVILIILMGLMGWGMSRDRGAAKVEVDKVEVGRVLGATRGEPYVNGLGMKFVPAGTDKVLFGVWETRWKDFRAFVSATGYDAIADTANGEAAFTLEKEGEKVTMKQARGSWVDARFPAGHAQDENHPVVCVSYLDAEAFYEWLTKKERDGGNLPKGWKYRLPTDEEWSVACGPEEYPWGEKFPPGNGDGNYSGVEAMVGPLEGFSDEFEKGGRNDEWARTAPVGSFVANRYGLYDMGGNVWEWCSSWYVSTMNDAATLAAYPSLKDDGGGKTARVVRGGSWRDGGRVGLRSAYRNGGDPRDRDASRGFRVVLVGGGG